MRKKWWITISVILVLVLAIFFVAGYYLGNVPLASAIMGTNKPKDLGVEISVKSAYSGLKTLKHPTTAEELRAIRDNPQSFTSIKTTLSNEEASSLLAAGIIPDFPFRLTQIKFGPNGNVQASGILYTAELQRTLRNLGMSGDSLDKVMSYVKNASALTCYMEGTCSITNNRIDLKLDSLQIGRIGIPETIVKNNLGSIGNSVSQALTSRGYNIRKMSVSEGRLELDMDRPLGSVLPWLDFVQY